MFNVSDPFLYVLLTPMWAELEFLEFRLLSSFLKAETMT